MQIESVHIGETFALMAKLNTICVILVLASAMDLEMHQMDVKTTFLNNASDMEIYMEQPEEFEQTNQEHLVCKLKKFLCGLNQLGII